MKSFCLGIALLLFTFHSSVYAGEALVPVHHFPPWKITEPDTEPIHGIDIELVRALFKEVNITPNFVRFPWARSLQMLQTGEADLISGALKRPEREETMFFLHPPYKTKSSKAFYIRADAQDITRYEDLHERLIGIHRGSSYFPRFDNDHSLRKQETHSDSLNLKKLIEGRIDVVIGTESRMDYTIATNDLGSEVRKTTFRHDAETPVYFAISKTSPLMFRVKELSEAIRRLKGQGVFERIIHEQFKAITRSTEQ